MMDERTREMLRRMAADVPPLSTDAAMLTRRARRRVARTMVSMVVAFAVVAGGGIVLARSGAGRGIITPTPVSSGGSKGFKEVSAPFADQRLRCVARIPTVLQPGRPTGVTVRFENVSGETVSVVLPKGSLDIAGHTGPAFGFRSGPMRLPTMLAAGDSMLVPIANPTVRWSGPLDLTVRCESGEVVALPSVRVEVAVPGPNPDRADAIRRALSARPGLLDRCMPNADGSARAGALTPPDPSLPPLTARCAAVVTDEKGFAVVDVQIVAPADAPTVEFADDLNQIAFPGGDLPGDGSIALVRWRIIVTADAVIDDGICCEAAERTVAGAIHTLAPSVFWEDGRWKAAGEAACGGISNGFTWISVCSR